MLAFGKNVKNVNSLIFLCYYKKNIIKIKINPYKHFIRWHNDAKIKKRNILQI